MKAIIVILLLVVLGLLLWDVLRNTSPPQPDVKDELARMTDAVQNPAPLSVAEVEDMRKEFPSLYRMLMSSRLQKEIDEERARTGSKENWAIKYDTVEGDKWFNHVFPSKEFAEFRAKKISELFTGHIVGDDTVKGYTVHNLANESGATLH